MATFQKRRCCITKYKVLLSYFLKNNALKFLLFANYFVILRRKQIKQNLT